MQSLVDATGGRLVHTEVTGPLGTPVTAFYGILGDGRPRLSRWRSPRDWRLCRRRRNPLATTTRGTGELITSALNEGVSTIILGGRERHERRRRWHGAGDRGAVADAEGSEIGHGGGELHRIARIDTGGADPRLKQVAFVAACDVDNPLTGERGASAVFGPQKAPIRPWYSSLTAISPIMRR